MSLSVERDPVALIPCVTVDFSSSFAFAQMFVALVQYDDLMNPMPYAAESWDILPNGLKYTFYLDDVNWNDGVPLTAEDVKFSWLEVVANNHPRGTLLMSYIDSVVAIDSKTVEVNMKTPFPGFIYYLGISEAAIIPKHIYEGLDLKTDPKVLEPPVVSGPYKFKEWVKGSYVALERNPEYFRADETYFDQILLKIIPNVESRVLALEAGEIDWLPAAPLTEVGRLQDLGFGTSFRSSTPVSQKMIFFNVHGNDDHLITTDKKVRQAIAYAIDNEEISEAVTFGLSKPGTSQFPSTIKYYNPDVPNYDLNIEKANQLLDEAGYTKDSEGKRFSIDIVYEAEQTGDQKSAELLRSMLDKVGITVDMRPLAKATAWETAWVRWDYDMFIAAATSAPEPAIVIERFYHSRYANETTPWRGGIGYNNPEADELFNRGAVEVDEDKRTEIYHELQMILMDDLPSYSLIENVRASIFRSDIEGYFPPGPPRNSGPLDNCWYKAEEPEPPPDEPSSGFNPIIIGGIVIIIAVAGIIIYQRRN
ncbi:ABC transporter substrate-binding protein [Thermoproteota archaeon]